MNCCKKQHLTLKIKKLYPGAVIPSYAKNGDAGLDLTAASKEYNDEHNVCVFGTGIAVEIPHGYMGLVFPRSSLFKTPLLLANSVGIIDSGYRGEIKLIFRNVDKHRKNYNVGDRIGQLVLIPFPYVETEEVPELSETSRGDGGFGSSGH